MEENEAMYWRSRWPDSKEQLPVPECLQNYMKDKPTEAKKVSVVDRVFNYLKWKPKQKEEI